MAGVRKEGGETGSRDHRVAVRTPERDQHPADGCVHPGHLRHVAGGHPEPHHREHLSIHHRSRRHDGDLRLEPSAQHDGQPRLASGTAVGAAGHPDRLRAGAPDPQEVAHQSRNFTEATRCNMRRALLFFYAHFSTSALCETD